MKEIQPRWRWDCLCSWRYDFGLYSLCITTTKKEFNYNSNGEITFESDTTLIKYMKGIKTDTFVLAVTDNVEELCVIDMVFYYILLIVIRKLFKLSNYTRITLLLLLWWRSMPLIINSSSEWKDQTKKLFLFIKYLIMYTDYKYSWSDTQCIL